jgi:hypothetical protein
MLTASDICIGQTDADRILAQVRNQIVALRVFGDRAPTANFPKGEPPIWGTGFVVGPIGADINNRQRIVTAAHVVQKDEMWAKRGFGPARTVFPWVLGQSGRSQMEGFRGVALHVTHDIAHVTGPRNMSTLLVQHVPLAATGRYFVVSWGLDDAWGEPTEEPYVKEIKLVLPAPADPPLENGLVLVEVLPGQKSTFFKQSESGSPVLDVNGYAVGIMIRARVDVATGVATRGVALPFSSIGRSWLEGLDPVASLNEPNKFLLEHVSLSADEQFARGLLQSLTGGCVFLGKYSARDLDPNSEQALVDAPGGIRLLRRVAGLFPEVVPERVLDNDAVVSIQLPEPEELMIAPRGTVDIRAHCPDVVAKPKRREGWERNAYYGVILQTVGSSFGIRVRQVSRQAYSKDFFYWALVDPSSALSRGLPR